MPVGRGGARHPRIAPRVDELDLSLHREHEARNVDLGAGLIGLQCPGILEGLLERLHEQLVGRSVLTAELRHLGEQHPLMAVEVLLRCLVALEEVLVRLDDTVEQLTRHTEADRVAGSHQGQAIARGAVDERVDRVVAQFELHLGRLGKVCPADRVERSELLLEEIDLCLDLRHLSAHPLEQVHPGFELRPDLGDLALEDLVGAGIELPLEHRQLATITGARVEQDRCPRIVRQLRRDRHRRRWHHRCGRDGGRRGRRCAPGHGRTARRGRRGRRGGGVDGGRGGRFASGAIGCGVVLLRAHRPDRNQYGDSRERSGENLRSFGQNLYLLCAAG